MTPVFECSDRYVAAAAAADPIEATYLGIDGHDDRLTDHSPEGYAERAALARSTLAELAGLTPTDEADRLAAAVLAERLGVELELHDSGAWRRNLNTIASPVQDIRQVFDLADTDSEIGRQHLAARLAAVADAVSGYRASLRAGIEAGDTVAIRQVEAAMGQIERLAPSFVTLVEPLADDSPAGRELDGAARSAAAAYEDLGRWLAETYAPAARAHDGVGAERYRLLQRSFLGADPDPVEAYAWGWDQIAELGAEMARLADEILPGAGIEATLDHLENRSDFAVEGIEAFRDWAQAHVEATIERFGRDHFDIAEAIRTCEVRIAEGGGSSAAYYIGPSEDGSRPGCYWKPNLGDQRRYPLWSEVTTANHEAVPGHHLQVAHTALGGAPLSRFQKSMCWISGHGEGWALYAERLCDELGLLERPEERMGYLSAAMLRSVRVVIDIGVHCGFDIAAESPVAPGQPWSWERAFELASRLTGSAPDEIGPEIDRYFGWPGQAPSYKLGEREWLAAREAAREAAGAHFDLRSFHTRALDLGSIGLDLLRDEVVRAVTG